MKTRGIDVVKDGVDMMNLQNRRFMYDPVESVLILGGKTIKGSHAQEFHDSGAPGAFDDFIRGWICGKCKEYPEGIIHFAPNIPAECTKYFDKAFATLEYFMQNGASKGTIIRGFGNVWERPLSDIYQ